MPDKGFRSVNVTQQVWEKLKSKAKQEQTSISAYATEVLTSFIEADERLSHYAPLIEVVAFEGNSVILRDKKLARIVEVYLHEKELSCRHDDSRECVHVAFCQALPQVRRFVR